MKSIVYLFIFTIGSLLPSISNANLLISPTRLLFNENSTSEEILLINSSSETRSYRIEWKELVALPHGGYREFSQDELNQASGLSRIVRVSPKQVTLEPNQRQTIRLKLRRSSGLEQGEYRSHLSFIALPSQKKNDGDDSLGINVLISYTMPIIYRVGSVNVTPEITNISLVNNKETGITNIKVDLFHDDLFSTHGRLVANWTPFSGSTRQVGLLNGYNFYPEVKNATTQFPWKDFKLEPGTLEVRYEGQGEFAGLLLGQKTLTITQQMINSIR